MPLRIGFCPRPYVQNFSSSFCGYRFFLWKNQSVFLWWEKTETEEKALYLMSHISSEKIYVNNTDITISTVSVWYRPLRMLLLSWWLQMGQSSFVLGFFFFFFGGGSLNLYCTNTSHENTQTLSRSVSRLVIIGQNPTGSSFLDQPSMIPKGNFHGMNLQWTVKLSEVFFCPHVPSLGTTVTLP